MTDIEDEVFFIPEISIHELDVTGSGNKQLVVVVQKNEYGPNETATLERMIAAIKYDMSADILLLQLKANQDITLNNLLPDYKNIILFGMDPSRIGIFVDFALYNILQFEQSRMLVCDAISDINSVQAKKVLLWNKLQDMFLK